jgi:pimeloyl-ACP methyl ester carboxylesterase
VREQPFAVAVGDGLLAGHHGGDGRPALLLHGGPAWSDYTGPCAETLDGLFAATRYTQRGAPPTTVTAPYRIEDHMADALAVLDHFGLERAWAVGHSWGGHLALHLLVAHPDRLLGVVCIDPLGAFDRVFAAFGANLRRLMSPGQAVLVDDIEERRRRGEVTEADLKERSAVIWPLYFAHPESAPPLAGTRVGVECSIGTNASIADHFARGTLASGLPGTRLPALFVHGEADPLPPSSSIDAAALIPGAVVETIPDCGHFPWLEQPAALRAAVARFLAARPA